METNQKNLNLVNLTATAREEIKRLFEKENPKPDGLRLSLLAGGCSGLSYHMEFDKIKDNDYASTIDSDNNIRILIDPKSALYLSGIVLNYQGGLNGKGFTFENPNAKQSCGCGTSFSVGDKEVVLEFVSDKKPNACPTPQQ